MTTSIASRELLVQLQVGVNANGQPKLQNHLYANVDAAATEAQMTQALNAISSLFAAPVQMIGYMDTIVITPSTATASTVV